MKPYTRTQSNRVRISITQETHQPIHITATDTTLEETHKRISEVLQEANVFVYGKIELRGERNKPVKVQIRQYKGRKPTQTVSISTEGSTCIQIAKLIETLFG